MDLRIETHMKYNEYMNLVDQVYKEDKNFKLNCGDIIINLFEEKGAFCDNSEIISVGVYDKAALIAGCFLVIPNNYQESVLVCFLKRYPIIKEL